MRSIFITNKTKKMGKNIFNSVKMTKPGKNQFDLSHDVKLSCDMGKLIPTMCLETIPGDKFNISCESLLRFAPLVSPVMHRMDVYMHYFFVPNRLLWKDWENYITNTPTLGSLPAFPTITLSNGNYSKLHDYMGIPTPPAAGAALFENVSALPFAAYQRIYNDYYRDQNLITEVNANLESGDNTPNLDLNVLRTRAWEHDYFTASLPFAQKGEAVSIPLGDVSLKSPWFTGSESPNFKNTVQTPNPGSLSQDTNQGLTGVRINAGGTYAYDPDGTLTVDSTTINDLRKAFKLQEWLEKAARGGSRYIENIFSHFGVKSSDKRLQRPEYITGTTSPVIISEVLNTSDTANAPQGNMAGHAISVTNGHGGGYYCEEHGYIIGIMSIMPKTAYQQGIPKHFLKIEDPFQFYWPSFANIGEQEVQNRELYAWQFGNNGGQTFGYVPRYAEYKYMDSRVSGNFRNTLDFWHMGRIFATPPALNQEFVECVPDNRIFAVQTGEDHLYAHIMHRINATRSMPKYGTPTF